MTKFNISKPRKPSYAKGSTFWDVTTDCGEFAGQIAKHGRAAVHFAMTADGADLGPFNSRDLAAHAIAQTS